MKGIKGSTLPLSEEEAIKRINIAIDKKNNRPNISLTFIGFAEKWHGYTTKLILHCNVHDFTWNTTTYSNFVNKESVIGCRKCKSDSVVRTHKLTKQEAFERLIKKYKDTGIDSFDFTPVLTTYTGFKDLVTVKCKIHGTLISYPYVVFLNNVHSNHCPDCYAEFRRSNRCPEEAILTEKILEKISLLSSRGYNLTFLGYDLEERELHPSTNSKIILHCNIHNVTWNTTIVSNFINAEGVFCPECSRHSKRSNGERYCYSEVLKYVDKEKVLSNKVISFNDSRFYNISNTLLPDIYITDFKSQDIIIEYDGEQHYRFVEHIHKDEVKYLRQVRRDQFLQDFCKENNIRLLRISWKDEKRIPEIIRSFLVDELDITTKVYPIIHPVIINK